MLDSLLSATTAPAEAANIVAVVSEPSSCAMCPQPAHLILMDLENERRGPTRALPEFSVRAYCKLCLGSGSITRSVRAPSASRRGGDGHDDGLGGDDGGDGPPLTPHPARRRARSC